MSSIEEKRVYGDRTGATELYVASELGVTVVSVSADQIGEFGLEHRCSARDVAVTDRLAIATDEDVLVDDGEGLVETGFGPAVAVSLEVGLTAAGEAGTVSRYVDGEWHAAGTVGAVRALDGDLVAAASGVYRVGDDLTHVGLDAARDVDATGLPLAATDDGLYYLGNGWMDAHPGSFGVVGSDDDRAHAATADALYERGAAPDEWTERALPVADGVADVGHGEGVYAVTREGTVLVDAGDGWRSRALGLSDVAALAVDG